MNLLGMLPDDLVAALAQRGVTISLSEARSALCARIAENRALIDKRKLTRIGRLAIAEHTRDDRPVVVQRVEDPVDRSVRYLLQAEDGVRFEAVRIGLEKPNCFTVCLSSQVGCAMRCAFCATGRLGLSRDLTAAEIVGAFLVVRDEAPGRVTGAVFMGQGEPFHNYDAVIQAARVLSDPCGGRVDAKNISISTVGLVPQIRRYTREGWKFRLIVSVTSAVAERRASLLPVAGRIPLADLAEALRERAVVTGDRVTIAWVLLGGVNTGEDEVQALLSVFDGVPLRVNLIDVNDAREDGFVRADDAERTAFFNHLQALRAPIVRRYSVGASQNSACGMLAALDAR
jgi:23S rRNA (adenine2503-C2)-methyltransferase